MSPHTIAFAGVRRLAAGTLVETTRAVRAALAAGELAPVVVFDSQTSERIEPDPRGPAAVDDRVDETLRSRGRPKLGVTAREVTLLPRHWDWLGRKSGGASAALRRLVEEARRVDAKAEGLRLGRDSLYRFVTVMVGDAPGYEESLRALFAGDRARFEVCAAGWPDDVRAHAVSLAEAAFGPPPVSLDCLPAERRDAVGRAIAIAFPGAVLEAAAPMAPGASGATVFVLTLAGADWVLRLGGPPDAYRDPARQFACMAMAQAVGVAPLLVHADVAERLSITRRVVPRPADPPLSRTRMLTALSGAVRRLHEGPLFPARGDYMTHLGRIIESFAVGGAPTADVAAVIDSRWNALRAQYPQDVTLVASHNDLNPSNVIFDGERPWIVDWEASAAADPYVDVAAVANWFAADEDEADLVLEAYLDRAPGEVEKARFALMRRINRLFYGVLLLNAAGAGGAGLRVTLEDLERAPRVQAIRSQMPAIADEEGRRLFGLAFLRDALKPEGDSET